MAGRSKFNCTLVSSISLKTRSIEEVLSLLSLEAHNFNLFNRDWTFLGLGLEESSLALFLNTV